MKRTTKPKKPAGKAPDADDPKFLPVIEAMARDRHVTRGRMFGSTGLKVNGKVFAMLVKGKFVAKLPKERVDQLVASRIGEYFDPGHGKLMTPRPLSLQSHRWRFGRLIGRLIRSARNAHEARA